MGPRTLVGTPYMADRELRAEYERDIAPRTLAALGKVLTERYPPADAASAPRRVLDLGCGTGAAGQALRAHFGDAIDLVAVDRVALSPEVRRLDVTAEAALRTLGRFDLVVAVHVVNELFVDDVGPQRIARLADLVRGWCRQLLQPNGRLIVIDPALRETARALLGVRDRLIEAGLHIEAPCFFQGPCPALARDRDWCHDTAPTPDRRRVDFSYLVVRDTPAPVVPADADPTLYRVVSEPFPEKGRLRLFVCGAPGRHQLIRLDRHRSEHNQALDSVVRGDILAVSPPPSSRATPEAAGPDLRVSADTKLSRVGPPSPRSSSRA